MAKKKLKVEEPKIEITETSTDIPVVVDPNLPLVGDSHNMKKITMVESKVVNGTPIVEITLEDGSKTTL